MSTPTPPAELSDLARRVRRHWPVVALAAVLGLLAGVGASFAIPTSYTATAAVSVNPMNANPLESVSTSSVSMPTEEQVVQSRTVATAATALIGGSTAVEDVLEAVSVTTPQDSLVLSIDYSAGTAEQAATGADAVAQAYLQVRRDEGAAELDRLQEAAQDRLARLQRQAASASAIQQRTINVQVESLASQLAQLGNVDLNPGQVIGAAETPTAPSSPGPVPLGLAGLVLGLLVGVPLALARRDRSASGTSAETLTALGDHVVLDGTTDARRGDTWDVAAFMLQVPEQIDGPGHVVLVDASATSSRMVRPGQELVDALARRGRSAHLVDASAIDDARIDGGWPADVKRQSWAGELVVIDTSSVAADSRVVTLAGRCDSVVLACSSTDESAGVAKLVELMHAQGVEVTLAALFPPRPELALR